MTPDSGPAGTLVVFEGRNLQPLEWVEFDGTPAEFRSISATRFEAVAPAGVTRGRVTYGIDGRRQWGPVFRPTEGSPPPPPPPPPPGDTEPPSTPTNVRQSASTTSSVTFAWNASTDNVGVTGYSLYRDGTLNNTTTQTTVTYNGLPCGARLTFGVSAHDAAGNNSGTTTISGGTAACPPPTGDTTPPSAPSNLRSTGATQTSITVAWNASTDNVGVAGYGLYRNGSAAGTTASTTTTFSNLVCGTTYSLGVEAYDAANNRSTRSTVSASTSTCTTPPPSGTCTIATTAGCVPGSTLTFRDTQFRCTQPLSNYGRLPLKVVLEYTPGRLYTGNGAVDLIDGCVGDGNSNTIDLIVDVRGDGRTYGPGQDALKVRLSARDIQITGHADCGPRQEGAHQDGIQLQGGTNIAFVDFTVGNYDAGLATCQGAGGAFFYSGANGNTPQNTSVIRGKYIGCNHSLLMGSGSGSVADAMFRSGRTDGTDPVCTGFAASPACQGESASITTRNLTCENWNRSARRWEP